MDKGLGMEHCAWVCVAVDKLMRAHEACVWNRWLSKGMYVCGSCIKVNWVLEGGPTGQGRGGPTHTKQHQNSLWWSPVEEYASCIEGAGCSRKSLHKQLSATVKAKGKSNSS